MIAIILHSEVAALEFTSVSIVVVVAAFFLFLLFTFDSVKLITICMFVYKNALSRKCV